MKFSPQSRQVLIDKLVNFEVSGLTADDMRAMVYKFCWTDFDKLEDEDLLKFADAYGIQYKLGKELLQ